MLFIGWMEGEWLYGIHACMHQGLVALHINEDVFTSRAEYGSSLARANGGSRTICIYGVAMWFFPAPIAFILYTFNQSFSLIHFSRNENLITWLL